MSPYTAFNLSPYLPLARLKPRERQLTGSKVLIVDDDEDDQYFLQQALILSGHSVKVSLTANGEQCLRFLGEASRLPDLIILDLNMPLLNGFDVLRHIKGVPLWSTLAVVVMSTNCDATTQQLTMALGAKACLSKPVDTAGYRNVVELLYRLHL